MYSNVSPKRSRSIIAGGRFLPGENSMSMCSKGLTYAILTASARANSSSVRASMMPSSSYGGHETAATTSPTAEERSVAARSICGRNPRNVTV